MKKELKIGIFAVVVLVAAFFVINFLRGEDILDREAEYLSVYSDIEGLVASAPVYIKGYKAGKVSDVEYSREDGMFTVTCSVSKDFEIPADSRMTIYSVDIMGSKGVRIDLGDSDVVAEDGDTLESCFESGLLDSVSEKIIPLMEKVEHTIDSLNVTVSGVNRILTSSNTEHIRRTFMHVESLTANLRKVSDQVNGKSTEIAEIIDNLNVLSAGLKVVMDKVDTTFTEAGEAMASLNAADLTGTVNSIRSLVDNLNDPEGTFGRLMKDDSVYDSVDSLLNNLDRFIDKIQQNPKKYLKISVF